MLLCKTMLTQAATRTRSALGDGNSRHTCRGAVRTHWEYPKTSPLKESTEDPDHKVTRVVSTTSLKTGYRPWRRVWRSARRPGAVGSGPKQFIYESEVIVILFDLYPVTVGAGGNQQIGDGNGDSGVPGRPG